MLLVFDDDSRNSHWLITAAVVGCIKAAWMCHVGCGVQCPDRAVLCCAVVATGQSVVNVYMNKDKNFAFIEFRTGRGRGGRGRGGGGANKRGGVVVCLCGWKGGGGEVIMSLRPQKLMPEDVVKRDRVSAVRAAVVVLGGDVGHPVWYSSLDGTEHVCRIVCLLLWWCCFLPFFHARVLLLVPLVLLLLCACMPLLPLLLACCCFFVCAVCTFCAFLLPSGFAFVPRAALFCV